MYIDFNININKSNTDEIIFKLNDLLIDANIIGDTAVNKCYLTIFPNTGMKSTNIFYFGA